MSITAKEIAAMLSLSEAAASMALNGKAGVSDETREKVIECARNGGYDFSRINGKYTGGNIRLYIFSPYKAIINDTQFFDALIGNIERECRTKNLRFEREYAVNIDELTGSLARAAKDPQTGFLLLATEMSESELASVAKFDAPLVVMDTNYCSLPLNCVCINNRQGAYVAANYLLRQYHMQPGYLKSAFNIANFRERAEGFFAALRDVGLSPSGSVIHSLAPSVDGAYADMSRIIESGGKLARSYFSDNDLIAIGAIKAFKEHGINIPKDIAVIGFDDIPMCKDCNPPLASVNVAKEQIGKIALERLLHLMKKKENISMTTMINTTLIPRPSAYLY